MRDYETVEQKEPEGNDVTKTVFVNLRAFLALALLGLVVLRSFGIDTGLDLGGELLTASASAAVMMVLVKFLALLA